MANCNKRNCNANWFQIYNGKNNRQTLLSSFATRVTGTSFSVQSSLPELPPAVQTEGLLQPHLNMGSLGDEMLECLDSPIVSIDEELGGLNVKPKPKKHYVDLRCSNPKQLQEEFVVLSLTGVHEIDLRFCGCKFAPKQKKQLLKVALWPSLYKDPCTAATFDLLRHFQLVNLQGHTATTDFYRALVSLHNGTGLTKPPDQLQQFRTMACPQPGINLLDGWEKASASEKWLYALILAMDANFKQKSRL
uniref:CxC2-like cysteine cluster KDZ transposase-associated domain-containing protein n=1 Tax=Moniliophthora roreri TaxID=221103 RepID=A0A0W0G025_MONRR